MMDVMVTSGAKDDECDGDSIQTRDLLITSLSLYRYATELHGIT